MPAGRRNFPHQEWIYSCGSKLATQPFRTAVFDQVTLAHAVQARREVFEPEVSELIAACDQEMIVGIMASARKLAGLPDNPAIKIDHFGLELEGGRRFGYNVRPRGLRVGPARKWNCPQVFAGDQRAVSQVRERYRLKRREAVFQSLTLKARREFPLGGKPKCQTCVDVIAWKPSG